MLFRSVAPPQTLFEDPSSREDIEIDKIIEAAAERVNSRGQSFWDDEDADDLVEGAPSTPGSATSRTAPAATSRQTPEPGSASAQSPVQQPISGANQDEQPEHDRSPRAHSARVDENFFSQSQPATTYVLSDQAPKDNSLELVIMRDEIRDLRDRLDSSQKLIEDLMLRLANLTEIALQNRQN